jgi:hypothetical protein
VASAVGTATIDFGAWPGTNEASVAVTGQTGIGALSYTAAFPMAEASGAHTLSDSIYAALWMSLTASAATAGVGFTVYVRTEYTLTGTFVVRWVWSD